MALGVPDTGLPVGTVLYYNAHLDQSFLSWLKTGIGTPDALFQQIGTTLGFWGLRIVTSDYSAVSAWTASGPTPITLTVQMEGPQTYGQPDDVRSIIDGRIQDALASNPIVDSNISKFTLPPDTSGASSKTIDTGAPAASTSAVHGVFSAVGIDPGAIGTAISDAVKNATSGLGVGTGLIVLILGLAIVAAVLIGFSPTAPARAIAAAHRRGR
jgi:hypothetical protein